MVLEVDSWAAMLHMMSLSAVCLVLVSLPRVEVTWMLVPSLMTHCKLCVSVHVSTHAGKQRLV